MERLPLSQLLLYATGQFGWSLVSYSVANLLIYFYMPPDTGAPVFPSFLFQGPVLGILTLIGLLSALGRVFDAAIDPLVAHWSDRKESTRGKRRWFMSLSALPFALTAYMVFSPVSEAENATNVVWLALWLGLYYFFFTLYVIPYTALIAELGHTQEDRLRISTVISVTWALGFIAGNSVYALQSGFEAEGLPATHAFQRSLLLLNLVGLAAMLAPAWFLQEKRYARQHAAEIRLSGALQKVFSNRNYVVFLFSDLMYWLALSFIQLGIGFYVTVLFGLDKSYAFVFSLLSFLCSFLFYWPLNLLARRIGKKPLVSTAFGIFALLFAVVALGPLIPLAPDHLLYLLGVLAAFPLAAFGILPNALIGDLVERDAPELAGMFYGVRAFVMKIGIALANLIFPSLLLLGKSTDHPLGVQACALAATVFCLGGSYIFKKFREQEHT